MKAKIKNKIKITKHKLVASLYELVLRPFSLLVKHLCTFSACSISHFNKVTTRLNCIQGRDAHIQQNTNQGIMITRQKASMDTVSTLMCFGSDSMFVL